MTNKIPDVSVIIPMYNAEKYITETLNSVLEQTFQNFEVLVVDDCSTDKSAKIVENFISKIEGERIKLIRMKKNTGNPGVPRNRGLEFSRGKYIYFLDSDDIILETALEEMYNSAEKFQADVIYYLNYGISGGLGKDFLENVRITNKSFVTETKFLPYDLPLRLNYYLKFYFEAPPWLKFSRRDFLIKNNIKFPLNSQEDNLWTLELLCLAEKFLISTDICCIHRVREGSDSSSKKTLDSQVKYSLDRVVRGIKNLNDFLDGLKFFKDNPEFKYALFNFYSTIDFVTIAESSKNIPPHSVYETIKRIFGNYLGEHDALVSYLLTSNIFLVKNLMNRK